MRLTSKVTVAILLTLSLASCQKPAPEPAAEVATQLPDLKPWAPTEFDEQAKIMPTPNSQSEFFKVFGDKLKVGVKGEFETTEDYKKRTADADAFLAPISTKAAYAFTPEYPEMIYNADKQEYELRYSVDCNSIYPLEGGVSCPFGSATDSSDGYTGQNAYGTKAEVTTETGRDFYFTFTPASMKRYRDGQDYELPRRCPVPIEKAKTLKAVSMAYVVRVRKAEMIDGNLRTESATVSSPQSKLYYSQGIPSTLVATVCYDLMTREILHVDKMEK